tara:strand:- start:253 stop:519 length:267 start_codon:yes stop_codon:yes gene_type:complete
MGVGHGRQLGVQRGGQGGEQLCGDGLQLRLAALAALAALHRRPSLRLRAAALRRGPALHRSALRLRAALRLRRHALREGLSRQNHPQL